MLFHSRTPASREPGPLFTDLVASGSRRRWHSREISVSLAVHAAALTLALLLPLFLSEPLPLAGPEGIRVFYYDPPPPPPPPLPRGSGLGSRTRVPTIPAPVPSPVAASAPVPPPTLAAQPAEPPGEGDGGHPEGSVLGVPEGMEGGVEGGVVGGVPGGVVGGVLGGTGHDPVVVMSPDRPPRPLRMPKPIYPQEAFVRKVEGTVLLEIVIDETGRVSRARVLASVPLLDEAALATVRTWLFLPAVHQGRPVATLARAPVSFRIY
jgi:periplasmic protein TonB